MKASVKEANSSSYRTERVFREDSSSAEAARVNRVSLRENDATKV